MVNNDPDSIKAFCISCQSSYGYEEKSVSVTCNPIAGEPRVMCEATFSRTEEEVSGESGGGSGEEEEDETETEEADGIQVTSSLQEITLDTQKAVAKRLGIQVHDTRFTIAQNVKSGKYVAKKAGELGGYIKEDGWYDATEDNVFYSKSHYFRNGNLNGAECAQGQMMEMLRCARKARAEYVMKLDSGMIVNSFDNFLAPLWADSNTVVGFKLNPRMNYVAGVCYVFPVKGLYKGIRDFAVWYKKESETEEFAAHCPEDWAVSRCVAAVNDYTMIQFNQVEDSENWLLSPFDFDILDDVENIKMHPLIWHRFRIYDFVNFGNRYQLKCENPREVAAECMEQYMKFEELCQKH